jgi:hypothetical protein
MLFGDSVRYDMHHKHKGYVHNDILRPVAEKDISSKQRNIWVYVDSIIRRFYCITFVISY